MKTVTRDLASETCHEPGCGSTLYEVPGEAVAFCHRGHCWIIVEDPMGLLTNHPGLELMRRRRLDREAA